MILTKYRSNGEVASENKHNFISTVTLYADFNYLK